MSGDLGGSTSLARLVSFRFLRPKLKLNLVPSLPVLLLYPFLLLFNFSSAVLGHFSHPHSRPWKSIDEIVTPSLASIVGAASSSEVACTSTLTSNLHNLFVTFYQPEKEGKRKKILMEGKAFPSDQVSSNETKRARARELIEVVSFGSCCFY